MPNQIAVTTCLVNVSQEDYTIDAENFATLPHVGDVYVVGRERGDASPKRYRVVERTVIHYRNEFGSLTPEHVFLKCIHAY